MRRFCCTRHDATCLHVRQCLHLCLTNKIFFILLVPTTPGELRVNVSLEGILISWKQSRVQHGGIRYQLLGLENGVKREFCFDCGLSYLLNKTEPNMNYSFWVVSHNIQNGYESFPSSAVHFHTAHRSK